MFLGLRDIFKLIVAGGYLSKELIELVCDVSHLGYGLFTSSTASLSVMDINGGENVLIGMHKSLWVCIYMIRKPIRFHLFFHYIPSLFLFLVSSFRLPGDRSCMNVLQGVYGRYRKRTHICIRFPVSQVSSCNQSTSCGLSAWAPI